jgi:hypothetical protein
MLSNILYTTNMIIIVNNLLIDMITNTNDADFYYLNTIISLDKLTL